LATADQNPLVVQFNFLSLSKGFGSSSQGIADKGGGKSNILNGFYNKSVTSALQFVKIIKQTKAKL
jgi:hypothetical protein